MLRHKKVEPLKALQVVSQICGNPSTFPLWLIITWIFTCHKPKKKKEQALLMCLPPSFGQKRCEKRTSQTNARHLWVFLLHLASRRGPESPLKTFTTQQMTCIQDFMHMHDHITPQSHIQRKFKVKPLVSRTNSNRCVKMVLCTCMTLLPHNPTYSANSVLILKTRPSWVQFHFQMEEFKKLFVTRTILATWLHILVPGSPYRVTNPSQNIALALPGQNLLGT